MKTKWSKKSVIIMAVAVAALIFFGCLVRYFFLKSKSTSGEIFLYGEMHSVENILEKELELWSSYYHFLSFRESRPVPCVFKRIVLFCT